MFQSFNETNDILSKKWWQTTHYSEWVKKVFRGLDARWIGIASRLLLYSVKRKTVSSNERKDTGRSAKVWEAQERNRARTIN